jgi:5-methyltetrahydropteroyltriglutamate--homocysteine methyltransferase
MSQQAPAPRLGPLATTIIGSYAQPGWYISALEAIGRGEFGDADIQEAADDAAALAIDDQERVGIDLVTDGEVRRHDFILGFYGRLEGLRAVPPRRRLGAYLYDSTGHFETVGTISAPRGLGAVEEFRFASRRTSKPVKVAVAGPLTLANAVQLGSGYRDREDLLADLVVIVNTELRALAEAGCRFIQVDESYYHHHFGDRPGLVADVYDQVTLGVEDATLGLHVCFGNLRARPHSLRTYRHVLPALRASRAQVLFLEFANREMAELDLWRRLEMPQTLAAGVVDVKSSYRERPQDVAERLRQVLDVCPPERVWAVPDCGFWETPRWLAFRKLQALVEGAAAVRNG